MLRRRTAFAAVLLSALGSVTATGQELLLLATDATGNATPGASAVVVPDPAPDVPALRDVMPLPTPRTATADARGLVRVALDRPGLALVTTASGLGAVVARAFPGRAVRVPLLPMASLQLPEGTEVHAAVVDATTGERRRLPRLAVDASGSLRLPEGDYEVWWRRGDEVGWSTCRAASGHEARMEGSVAAPSSALPDVPRSTLLHPRGACELTIPAAAAHGLALRDQAAAGEFFVEDPATGALRVVTASGPREKPVVARLEAGPGAMAFVLAASRAGSFRVVAGARVADGRADLVAPEGDGDHWLVVTEPQQAARAVRLRVLEPDRPLPRLPARTLACSAKDARGEPVAFAAVSFHAADDGPALALAFTDELGRAHLGPVTGSGFVRIDDPRFLPTGLVVRADETAAIPFVLEAGEELHGRAVYADGKPASAAAVTVREPSGTLRRGELAVRCGEDGSFAFAGLDARSRLVVFASATRDGHTWSARATVRAGSGSIELVLRDEDPQLGAPREGR